MTVPFDPLAPLARRAAASSPGTLSTLRRVWHALPGPLRRLLLVVGERTGVPLVLSLLTSELVRPPASRFAGDIPDLLRSYDEADPDARRALLARFDAIADALVLPNGVRKTSYADRHQAMLRGVLDAPGCALPDRPLRILDLPASTGAASLGTLRLIAPRRAISSYVLADLGFHLLLDRARGCVFDRDGALLQCLHEGAVVNVHVPHALGDGCPGLARAVLAPLFARGEALRARYRADDAPALEQVPLLRPDVLARCRDGTFTLLVADVFAPIPGEYDLILSCNLLQSNYFPARVVEAGISRLGDALSEGGLLILGRPDTGGDHAHRVYRKRGGALALVRARGRI